VEAVVDLAVYSWMGRPLGLAAVAMW